MENILNGKNIRRNIRRKILAVILGVGLAFGYEFQTSSQLSFYFVQDIAGYEMQPGDWIYSFCGDECTGGKAWAGSYTDIPAYGDDGSPETDGYCYTGEVPIFIIVTTDGTEIPVMTITPQADSSGNIGNIGWSQFNMPIITMNIGVEPPGLITVITIIDGNLKAWKVDPADLIE